jgi:protease-4
VLAIAILAWASPALAQTPADAYDATRGVFIPWRTIAGDADASAVELNPGQLGQLNGSSLILVGNPSSQNDALPGRGVGLLFGSQLWSHNYFGIGLQDVGQSAAPVLGGRTKFQLGYALRVGRTFGIGISWAHIFGSAYDGADALDAGASWRLARGVALGVVAQDFNQSHGLSRAWTGELAIRPLGTDRLEVSAAAVHVEGQSWHAVAPRFRLAARVADGLRPFAEVESLPGTQDYALSSAADYRVTAGLWLDFDHLGGGGAVRHLRTDAPGGDAWGGSVFLSISGDRFPSLVDTRHIERVDLAKIHSDRDFLALAVQLRGMAADDAVAGLLLKVEDLELGLARIEEVRDLLAALRARGKKSIAYVVYPGTREMYLASACDNIVIHPAGSVAMNGIAQETTFYKDVMDRLGVSVDLVRIAEFKGAMEPFILNQQSEPVRDNKNRLLDNVFDRLVASIAEGREHARRSAAHGAGEGAQMTDAKVRALIDRGGLTPTEAQTEGLVDAVRDEGELNVYIGQASGHPGISVRGVDSSPVHPPAWKNRRLAVILVDGTIVDSDSQQLPFSLGSVAGADSLVAVLEQCKNDRSIAGVVLRVNSPGGSAFASDVIARAITRVRAAGKPVVVSMGDYAASGGYYISAPADVIFAQPSTITGSIGIFSFKVDVQKLLARVGVSVEIYRRGTHADLLSPFRPWTDDERKLVSEKIRYLYDLFLTTVGNGRKAKGVTAERANDLGRGQVWTGAQALGLGLVDQSGGVIPAIERAAQMARLRPEGGPLPELVVWPRPRSTIVEKALGIAGAKALASHTDEDDGAGAVDAGAAEATPLTPAEAAAALLAGPGAPGSASAAGRALLRVLGPVLTASGGPQARLPFDMEIR